MKKLFAMLLSVLMLLSICACSKETTPATTGGQTATEKPEEKGPDLTATEDDKAKLEALYTGLQPHHGQLHDHAKTGPRSDGNNTLTEWLNNMPGVGMEYAAILDHRQTHHMYLDEWDPTIFISGSEAMTYIIDRDERYNKYHYNMIFRNVEDMEAFLKQYILQYQCGKQEDHTVFEYLSMQSTKFIEIIQSILDGGGYFVIPHPSSTAPELSPDPMEYYFCDFIGYEVFYYFNKDWPTRIKKTLENYAIWTGMLANDKRVYASAGCDQHKLPTNLALSTVYSDQKLDTSYIDQLRKGNYTAGPVGIRMCIGDTMMGGTGTFAGQRVVVSVSDFHGDHADPSHTYRVDVVTDAGVVYSQNVVPGEMNYIAFDADENAKFYRIELHDENLEATKFDPDFTLLALGNPIWNEAFYE